MLDCRIKYFLKLIDVKRSFNIMQKSMVQNNLRFKFKVKFYG